MIRRIQKITQIVDLLDNPKASFYHGKGSYKDEVPKEKISKMDMKDLKKIINQGLIVKIIR